MAVFYWSTTVQWFRRRISFQLAGITAIRLPAVGCTKYRTKGLRLLAKTILDNALSPLSSTPTIAIEIGQGAMAALPAIEGTTHRLEECDVTLPPSKLWESILGYTRTPTRHMRHSSSSYAGIYPTPPNYRADTFSHRSVIGRIVKDVILRSEERVRPWSHLIPLPTSVTSNDFCGISRVLIYGICVAGFGDMWISDKQLWLYDKSHILFRTFEYGRLVLFLVFQWWSWFSSSSSVSKA